MPQRSAELGTVSPALALDRIVRATGAAYGAIVRASDLDGAELVATAGRCGAAADKHATAPGTDGAVMRALDGDATFGTLEGVDATGWIADIGAAWAVVPAQGRGVRAALALAWEAPRSFGSTDRGQLAAAGHDVGRSLEAQTARGDLDADLIDDTSVGLAVVDRELRVIRVNAAARALSPSGESALGEPLLDALPGLPPSLADDLRAVLDGEAPRTLDATEAAPGDGHVRHWLASVFPIGDATDEPRAGLALIDVSERVALEDERARRYRLERRTRREHEALLAGERRARERLVASERRRTQRLRLASRLARCRSQAAVARVVLSELRRTLDPAGAWIWRHDGNEVVALATTYGAELRDRFARIAVDADWPLAVAIRTARPVFVATAADWSRWPLLAQDAAELGVGATACVPLVVAGTAVGALAVDLPIGHQLDADERAFLVVLAGQAAQALDRARSVDDVARHAAALERALGEARAAEARAAQEAGRLDVLRGLAEALLEAATPAAIAAATLATLPRLIGHPLDATLLLGSDPRDLRAEGAGADASLRALAARAVRSSAPAGVGAAVALPLVDGRVHGVLAARGVRLGERDAMLALAVVAGQVGAALERLRLRADELRAHERLAEVSRRFQASLVPVPRVHARGVAVSAHYVAGDERMELGGDVLDACDAPGGGVAFLIGDVTGHGPEAAALGSVLRAAWRGIVLDDADPAASLARLDRLLASERRGDAFATAIAGLLRVDAGALTLAVAGHPTPLVVDRRGARPVDVAPGPPLGAVGRGRWPVVEAQLARGESLVLYTDGLTEARARPGRLERYGERRLVRDLARLGRGGPIDDAALEALVADVRRRAGGAVDDDIALLAVTRLRDGA